MERSLKEVKEKIKEIFGELDEDEFVGAPFLKSRKPTYLEVKQVIELMQQIQSLVGRDIHDISDFEVITHISNCLKFDYIYFEENNKESK